MKLLQKYKSLGWVALGVALATAMHHFTNTASAPSQNTDKPSSVERPVTHWNPAEYLKDFVVYKAGDGYIIYFILGDANGMSTASEGEVQLKIYWNGDHGFQKNVSLDDFSETRVGVGAFEHTETIYSFGRLSRESLSLSPDCPLDDILIQLVFTTPEGKTLEASRPGHLAP